jgi:hypothetical protein
VEASKRPFRNEPRPLRNGDNFAPLTDTEKFCLACKKMVPRSGFRKMTIGRGGLQTACRKCQNARKVRKDSEERRNGTLSPRTRSRATWGGMRRRALQKEYALVSWEEFVIWHNDTPRVCVYCDIPEHIALEKYQHRLNVDRKDGKQGYAKENICLACTPCNLVKSGYLTHEEMLEIGQKYMKPKWHSPDALRARIKEIEDAQ